MDKCGGSSIQEALRPYLSSEDLIIGTLAFEPDEHEMRHLSAYGLKKHAEEKVIKHYLNQKFPNQNKWTNMYKFTTVREPVEMFMAIYFYIETCIKRKMISQIDPFYIAYQKSQENETFADGFIQTLFKEKHTCTESFLSRVGDEVDIYDIAQINEHWDNILLKLNIYEKVVLNKLNTSEKRDGVYFNNTTIDLIKTNFQKDYEYIPKITGNKWE